ncbi:MAG: hypothetical protein AAGI23_04985 [Bacteroidota bacterium]
MSDTTTPLQLDKYYHIFNRCNASEWVFPQTQNYTYFLSQYKKYMLRYWKTYAYALLPNHFHLLVQIRSESELLAAALEDFDKISKSWFNNQKLQLVNEAATDLQNLPDFVNLTQHHPDQFSKHFTSGTAQESYRSLLQWIASERFRRFLLSYAKSIRSQEGNHGSLFQKIFRRKPVEGLDNLRQVTLYLHRNPIHHGYAIDMGDESWSSYRSFLSRQSTSLERQEVLGWFDGVIPFQQTHEQYVDEWRHTKQWLIEIDQ